jgi:hypothetical protein
MPSPAAMSRRRSRYLPMMLVTRFEARSALIEKAGVDRIILWGIREMKGDKIASSRCCLPDRTDSQTARFLEWDYAHPSK